MFKTLLAVGVKAFSINLNDRVSVRCFQEQVTLVHLCGLSFSLSVFLSYRWEYLVSANAPLVSYHCGKTGYYLVTPGRKGDAEMVTQVREPKKMLFFYIFIFKSIFFCCKIKLRLLW